MLNRAQRIDTLVELGRRINPEGNDQIMEIALKAFYANRWFTEENIKLSLSAISSAYLDRNKLIRWLSEYPEKNQSASKNVGLIMAGNIPLVGFHDFLCVFVAGHNALIKLSEKDHILFMHISELLKEIEPRAMDQIQFVDRLKDFDAVIATGSNNSARYFDYYFGKYPNIIRNNRTSVAVLAGNENDKDISNLGKDVFRYFGMGCRNVSKLYVPHNYDFTNLLEKFEFHQDIIMHNKYKNNFDYILTLLILNKIPYLSNSCILLHEDQSLHSRIASLHYEYYDNTEKLERDLIDLSPDIQCIVSNDPLGDLRVVPFGKAQEPELEDYSDGVNTLKFLMDL